MPLVDVYDDRSVRKAEDQGKYETLYDPPVDGATPLDGAGEPASSVIHLPDVDGKLTQGYTRVPQPEPPPPLIPAGKRRRK